MSRFQRAAGWCVLTLALLGVSVIQAGAQATTPPPALPTQSAQVDVVLARYLGEKKTSALPFTIILNATGSMSSMRMGVDVPVGTSTSNVTQTTGAQGGSPRAVETTKAVTEYRNIGTSIDASVSRNKTDETTYFVQVYVNDSSLFSTEPGKVPSGITDPTAFRTFTTQNTLTMKDGQTRLFGVATDKLTGETLKIEVKLTILK